MSENTRMDEAGAVTTAKATRAMDNGQQPTAFGSLTEADLRTAWPHEARDFTPWLAENLERLSEALGIPLETETTEAPVGEFAGDILATAPEGQSVLIENQLEGSDHSHLGQIMTYLAGLEARVVVWIARDFTEPHSSAIRWLNQHTENEFAFFAVKLRVVKIDDSPLAPIFEVIEKPNHWERQIRHERTGSKAEICREFWTHYARRYPDDGVKANYGSTNAWIRPRKEAPTISLAFSYVSGRVGIFFTRKGLSQEAMNEWFSEHRQIISNELGRSEQWEYFDTHRRENWNDMCDWLHEKRGKYISVIEIDPGQAEQASGMGTSAPSASTS